MRAWSSLWALAASGVLWSSTASAQDASTPGTPLSEHPTFRSLSLDWPLSGDDDADGAVSVRYRALGTDAWLDGPALFRVPAGSNQGFSWANRHAGSLFRLEPGTSYEIELTLTDPDGGDVVETLTVATRSIPVTPDGASETVATPTTVDDVLAAAVPGDVILLADGDYGELTVTSDGTEDMPITIRPENEGNVAINGDVRLDGRHDVIVEGLGVNGQIKFNDAARITLRGNVILTDADGVVSYGSGVSGAFIVDNLIVGPTQWYEGALGVDGDNLGEGIVLTGPGNVIAFNRVRGFRDCISLLEDGGAVNQVSIDVYGNDLSECADDAIEADFSMGNVRVFQNRIQNSFMGISSQPSLGGPTYFVRNVMYNVVYHAFKLHRGSVGDVGLHNTVVKGGDAFSVYTSDVFSRAYFRNNIFFGGPGADHNGYHSGVGEVAVLPSADPSCSFDYDAYGSQGGLFSGEIGAVEFNDLSELQTLTSEANALQVHFMIFNERLLFPEDPFATPYPTPDVSIVAGSAVHDSGQQLVGFNDDFLGAGPDRGALEIGADPPVYGPGGTLGAGASGAGGAGGGGGDGGAAVDGAGGSGAGSDEGGADAASDGGSDDGCACSLPAPSQPAGAWSLLALAWLAITRRRSQQLR